MANIVIRPYQLNVAPGGVETVVNLSQYENGRELVFHLVGEGRIDIPADALAIIAGTKPDETIYSAIGTVDADENTVSFQENVQMTAASGKWYAKVKVTASGQTIASGMVKFVIEKDVIPPDAEQSSSDIQGLIAEAAQYAEDARNSFANDARTMNFADLNTTSKTVIGALNELDSETSTLDSSVSDLEALTFPNLPVRTATADSDLIHVNSGGVDYKETKFDFLEGGFHYAFNNTASITSQADALGAYACVFGTVSNSSSVQATLGLPLATSGRIEVRSYNANFKKIWYYPNGNTQVVYTLNKASGTWASTWVQEPTRDEITSINSSLTNSLTEADLLNRLDIPTTFTSYACNWSQYRLLIFCQIYYGNIMSTIVVPSSYINITTSGTRIMMYTPSADRTWEIYKNGTDALYMKASSSSSTQGIRIIGIGKIS